MNPTPSSFRPRLLVAVNGHFSSHVARPLAIALELREQDAFDIAFSGSGTHMAMVAERGFDILETDHLSPEDVYGTSDEDGIHWYEDAARLDELFAAEEAVFDHFRPDVVLRDAFRDPASVVAARRGCLDIMVSQANELAPYWFDFVPVNYALPQTSDLDNLNKLVALARHRVYRPLFAKAAEMGVREERIGEFGARADLYLVADSYLVNPMAADVKRYRYIGAPFIVHDPVRPDWLSGFPRPSTIGVLVTTGSTGKLDFTQMFTDAQVRGKERFTLAFADAVPPPLLGGDGNIVLAVLPRCDVFVHHGGLGSTYMGLYAAKPMVALYDQFERQASAHRIEQLGIGTGMPLSEATPEKVLAAGERLASDPSVTRQLTRIQRALLAEPDPAVRGAVEVIELCRQKIAGAADALAAGAARLDKKAEAKLVRSTDWVAQIACPQETDMSADTAGHVDTLQDEIAQTVADAVVQVKDLGKRYKDLVAVDGVSFEVYRGEVFGLLGPNGAGKSTTIEILTGNRPRSRGDVTVLGMDPSVQGDDLKQVIGVQLQDVRLFKNLTVDETLELFASFYDNPRPVAEVLDLVGLQDKSRERVGRLSGGQTQRVGIAASMIGRGEILFMDEPTAGLDPKNRRMLMEAIRGLRTRETTVFLTTHFMDEAQSLCDRVAIIDQGRLIALDTPARLIAQHCPETVVRIARTGLSEETTTDIVREFNAQVSDDELICYCSQVVDFINALTRICHARDQELRGVAFHQATLEDVFLNLTGREVEKP